jgi:hypothetical protein
VDTHVVPEQLPPQALPQEPQFELLFTRYVSHPSAAPL